MTQALVHHCVDESIDESKEQIRHHAIVLREYAKWSLLRGYVFSPSREAHRKELMEQFLAVGDEVHLTERDMVLLLYRGLFCDASSPASC